MLQSLEDRSHGRNRITNDFTNYENLTGSIDGWSDAVFHTGIIE